MKDIVSIVQLWDEMEKSAVPGVLATIVDVTGSHYRRPGARMLLAEDNRAAGSVSGGCMVADLKEHAAQVLRSGTPSLVSYDTSKEEDLVYGTGMGCGGVVELLLEPTASESTRRLMTILGDCLQTRNRYKMATVYGAPENGSITPGDRVFLFPDGGIRSTLHRDAITDMIVRDLQALSFTAKPRGKTYTVADGKVTTLLEVLRPPLALLVFGAGDDAKPLVAMAKTLGWQVTVADHRADFAAPRRFPSADSVLLVDNAHIDEKLNLSQHEAVVIMTHNYFQDRLLLQQVLLSDVPYIGLLGAAKRSERILEEIKQAGLKVTDAQYA
ncbi:MAG: XdhC/CoxI family protein, partial [Candidatus Zixiibacteriota bacterium]